MKLPNNSLLNRINQVFSQAKSGSILLPPNPSIDAIASATALYLGLSQIGITLTIACSTQVSSDLFATDKIQTNVVNNGDNLVISFPYTEGAIDKIDYNIKENSFNLIIAPRPGYPKLDPSQVKYSYTGKKIDFLVVINAPTLESLGSLYTDNEDQFIGCEIINIDRHLTNTNFGTINLIEKTSSSISEIVFKILQFLKEIKIDREIATNLYAGIAFATNNFTSYSTNADTFETVAHLLRMGAIKKVFKKPTITTSTMTPPTKTTKPNFSPSINFPIQTPIEQVEKEKQNLNQSPEDNPQDWLKPKIFKGKGLI